MYRRFLESAVLKSVSDENEIRFEKKISWKSYKNFFPPKPTSPEAIFLVVCDPSMNEL
jgi:hypothetical protein